MSKLASTVGVSPGFASPSADPKKIIQRILRARRSYSVTEGRMHDADEALVLQSQRGDLAAFEMLIEKHQRMIHSLTYRMTGSMDDAEDLAQETFVRAFRNIGSYRSDCKFSTWLYRIAINVCLTWRDREHLRTETSRKWSDEQITENEGSTTADTNEQLNGRLQAALLKLPAKQRAAIMLTMYDGLSHAEAADVLNCSETTVSWRVFSAKRKLKRLLSLTKERDERL